MKIESSNGGTLSVEAVWKDGRRSVVVELSMGEYHSISMHLNNKDSVSFLAKEFARMDAFMQKDQEYQEDQEDQENQKDQEDV